MKIVAWTVVAISMLSLGFRAPGYQASLPGGDCICMGMPSPSEQARSSRHAFVGIPLDAKLSYDQTWRYTFWVERGWRGAGLADTVLVLARKLADCGATFLIGHRYTVIAGDAGGTPGFSECDNELRFGSAASDTAHAVLGNFRHQGPTVEQLVALFNAGAQSPDSAIVMGQVVHEADGPIEGAAVELPRADMRATTDSRGAFILSQVPLGAYVVTVRPQGGDAEEYPLLVRCSALPGVEDVCVASSGQFVLARPKLPDQ